VGWAETAGYITIEIPDNFSDIFLDGKVEVKYEVLQLGPGPGTDAFAFDFSELVMKPNPAPQTEELILFVLDLQLSGGLENGLITKLSEALDIWLDHNIKKEHVAINKLFDFINQVSGQKGKKISISDADVLISLALEIITTYSGEVACPCWQYDLDYLQFADWGDSAEASCGSYPYTLVLLGGVLTAPGKSCRSSLISRHELEPDPAYCGWGFHIEDDCSNWKSGYVLDISEEEVEACRKVMNQMAEFLGTTCPVE